MINLVKEENDFYLIIGFSTFTNTPKNKLLLTENEVHKIASDFNETFAEEIGLEERDSWTFGSLKVTSAPDHPFGYTDSRERTILHYNHLSWHMIIPEIHLIGELAKKLMNE